MAPKAPNLDLTDSNTKFILSVLKHCTEIKPDWEEVARENGITYSRNAGSRFREIIKKLGLRYENGKIIDPNSKDGDKDGIAAAATKKSRTSGDKKGVKSAKTLPVKSNKRKAAGDKKGVKSAKTLPVKSNKRKAAAIESEDETQAEDKGSDADEESIGDGSNDGEGDFH